jgi:hypothetical protein
VFSPFLQGFGLYIPNLRDNNSFRSDHQYHPEQDPPKIKIYPVVIGPGFANTVYRILFLHIVGFILANVIAYRIVSRHGVSIKTIGVKFRPKQSDTYVSCTWRVALQKFMTQQTGDLPV